MEDILNLNSSIYDEMKKNREDNQSLQKCVEESVDSLMEQDIPEGGLAKPICLLGKIQSGKTRAFVGVIARAFDRGMNTVVVLT